MMAEVWRDVCGIESIPITREEEQRLRNAGRNMVGALRIIERPTGPAKAHEFLVGQLVAQGAKRHGFKRALRDTFPIFRTDHERCNDGDCLCAETGGHEAEENLDWFTYAPDAFTLTPDEVCIYEVEVSSHLPAEKLHAYAELWDLLDYYEEAFCRLFRVDTKGVIQEVDLPQVALDMGRESGHRADDDELEDDDG